MELDRIVRYQERESPEDICRRTIAAVVTQLSDYMYAREHEVKLFSRDQEDVALTHDLPYNLKSKDLHLSRSE